MEFYIVLICTCLRTASGPRQNIAEVTNRGIEMTLNWQDRIGKVEYRVSGNFCL